MKFTILLVILLFPSLIAAQSDFPKLEQILKTDLNNTHIPLEFGVPKSWHVNKIEESPVAFSFESPEETEAGSIQINSIVNMTGMSEEDVNDYSSEELADGLLTEDALKDLSHDPQLISIKDFHSKRTKFKEYFGGEVSFISTLKVNNCRATQFHKYYVILKSKHMVLFTFHVYKDTIETEQSFKNRIEKHTTLFTKMIDAIKFLD